MADPINVTNVGQGGADIRRSIASEATLSALLDVFKATSGLNDKQLKELQKLGKGYKPTDTKDPSSKAGKSLGSVSAAADALEDSLRGVPKQFEMFGDFLERGAQKPAEALGNSLKSVGGIAETVFGSKFFKYLGGGILAGAVGAVTTSFGMLAGYLQNSLEAFQDLSNVGGNFGNDLLELRRAALLGNLSLNEFSTLVKENSKLFATIGTNVSDGSRTFAKLSLDVRNFDSKRLRSLGYTVSDVNDMLTDYLDVASKSSDIQGDLAGNQEKVVKSAVKFGTELNEMASISGLSRKQISKEIKEITERGEVQAAMLLAQQKGVGDVDAKFRSLITAVTPFGKTAANAAADLTAFGGAFRTKESRAVLVAAPQFANTLRSYTQAITDNAPPDQIGEAFGDMVQSLLADEKRLTALARAGNQEAARMLSETTGIRNKYRKIIEAEGEEGLKKQLEKDKAAAAAQAKMGQQLTRLDEIFRDVSSKIMTTLVNSKIFEKMVGAIDSVAAWFNGPEFTSMLDSVIDKLGKGLEYLNNIFTPAGREKILNDLKETFESVVARIKNFFSAENRQEMWNNVSNALSPIFEKLSDVIASGIAKGFQLVMDKIFGAPSAPLTPVQEQQRTNVRNQRTNLSGAATPGTAAYMQTTEDINRMLGTVDNLPLPDFRSRAKGGGTGQGGVFKLHANEYVLNQDMIKDLNMTFDRMITYAASDRSSLYSAPEETKIEERTKTISDFSRAEQDQIRASVDSKLILQDIKEGNEQFLEMFRQHLIMQEQMQRDIGDLLDYYDKHA